MVDFVGRFGTKRSGWLFQLSDSVLFVYVGWWRHTGKESYTQANVGKTTRTGAEAICFME
jgi:hypothetical protein